MLRPMVKIKFKCHSVETFIEQYHSDVNPIGIFIRTRAPALAGTQVSFEFRLFDDAPLFVGTGAVLWARGETAGSDGAGVEPGMMLSFDELTTRSKQTFAHVLAEKQKLEERSFGTVPTLIRSYTEADVVELPMTTKMSADEVAELRARMWDEAGQNAHATPVVPMPPPLPPARRRATPPPIPASLPAPLASVILPIEPVTEPEACVPIARDAWETSGVIVSRLPPIEVTERALVRPRTGLNTAVFVFSVVGSLVLFTLVLMHLGYIGPALEWISRR
jgi:hypothetical protein